MNILTFIDTQLKEGSKEALFKRWSPPIALFLLLLLSFGITIPWLGYAYDEWHFIYYATRGAHGLVEIFHYDGHPQAVWSYIQSFNILGYNPLYWHLYSLLWRWLAVLSFWLCLKVVWLNNHRQNFFVAAIFAIHPIFTLQVFPISFYEIWLGYTIMFLSVFFTILAIQNPEKNHAFTIFAVALAVWHVFTSEYTWFIELMRPVFIWLVIPSMAYLPRKIFYSAKRWLPFLIIFISSLIWRGFLYTPLRKSFVVQIDMFDNPTRTLFAWVINLIPDVITVLVTSWYATFNSEYFYLTRPFNVILFSLIILFVIIGNKYLQKLDVLSLDPEKWPTQAIVLGLPSMLFGILPFYVAGYSLHLTEAPYNSRLAIGMLPGAALISAAIIETLISRKKLRFAVAVLFLSLSVVWHIRYTNDYRKIWAYQSNLLKQLTWRAPGIEKNTAIFVLQPSLPDIDNSDVSFVFYGDFALSMAINSIYGSVPSSPDGMVSYWYFSAPVTPIDSELDVPLLSEHATTYFKGNLTNSLFFYYDPDNGKCLHLITVNDKFYKQFPDTIKEISPYANDDQITLQISQNIELRDEIFDNQELTWCYYYQKAELARQYQRWQDIYFLWDDVTVNNLESEAGTEYMPFIDGFAHLNEWQQAKEITLRALKLSRAMGSALCPLWKEIDHSTMASAEKDETIRQVNNKLGCIN